MIRCTSLIAVAACALVAAPAASAHPGQRGFERTYPHASRLCAKVANGHAPTRLAASATQVTAACTTLKASFTGAQTAYTTTTAPLKQQGSDAFKALRTTCAQARANHDRATCRSARQSTRATLRSLRAQIRTAADTYRATVDGARKTFWATIRSLRGGSGIRPDRSVPAAPSVALPSDPSVANA